MPWRHVGLGLLVGAVLHWAASPAGAQQRDTVRARPDSIVVPANLSPQDSAVLAVADTSEEARLRADSLLPPLPRAEMPASLSLGAPLRWDREGLDATGALTLLDLIERIPGVTGFRTGWIASPQLAAYLGDPGGVRLFVDGLEMAALSPRAEPAFDLAEIQLWPYDEVVIERGAGELRVHLRTWSVWRTSPYTRTDVYTGDEDTNLYRGYFGRRYRSGSALQVAGEQYGTTGRRFGNGDQLSLLARVGIGRKYWAADAFVLRASRTRDAQTPLLDGGTPVSELDARRTTAYVRASTGNPAAGPWLQLIAASQAFRESVPVAGPEADGDTTISVVDYVATGGLSWRGMRISALARARAGEEDTRYAQSLRLGAALGPLAVQAYAENAMIDSVTRVDATAQTRLLGPLYASATAGWSRDRRASTERETSYAGRAELGLLVRGVWAAGGVIYRDSTTFPAASLLEQGYVAAEAAEAIGATGTVRGKVWRDVGIDLVGVAWESEGLYRPQFQGSSRIYVDTRWLSRFPSGNFGFRAWAQLEHRSAVPFPTASGIQVAGASNSISTLVEIRIVDAVLTWQLRNAAQWDSPQWRQAHVPGFLLPSPVNFYGVRWTFWN